MTGWEFATNFGGATLLRLAFLDDQSSPFTSIFFYSLKVLLHSAV